MIKSPIKWAGGKSWLIEKINQDFNTAQVDNVVDLFTGSAVVALNIPCNSIIANDISFSLINFHNQIKQGLAINQVYDLTETEYYKNRALFNIVKNNPTKQSAILFYYLNSAGFNGLYRENSKGEFNVPWGKKKTFKLLDYNLETYSKIIFINKSYEEVSIPKNSLIYVDPPYDTPFTKYSKNDFNWENQQELIKWLLNTKEKFIISNQATNRIVDLYAKYNLKIELLDAPRRINANGNRDKAKEVYAKNF